MDVADEADPLFVGHLYDAEANSLRNNVPNIVSDSRSGSQLCNWLGR